MVLPSLIPHVSAALLMFPNGLPDGFRAPRVEVTDPAHEDRRLQTHTRQLTDLRNTLDRLRANLLIGVGTGSFSADEVARWELIERHLVDDIERLERTPPYRGAWMPLAPSDEQRRLRGATPRKD